MKDTEEIQSERKIEIVGEREQKRNSMGNGNLLILFVSNEKKETLNGNTSNAALLSMPLIQSMQPFLPLFASNNKLNSLKK